MDSWHKLIVILLVFLLTAGGGLCSAFSDDKGHSEKRRYQKRERRHSEDNGQRNLPIVSDAAYAENCGACHFAYQPGLLPLGSWEKIIDGLSDHFGESIELDSESAKTIFTFLKTNAANYSSGKLSAKIMKSLGNQSPLRITEVPYIRKEHHEIQQNVLDLESIGSLSNCAACHTTAEKGIYDDDNVTIPW